jgi:hypothetical protein
LKVFICKICHEETDSQAELNAHSKAFHRDKRFNCIFSKSYGTKYGLTKHQRTCESFKASFCDEEHLEEEHLVQSCWDEDLDLSGLTQNEDPVMGCLVAFDNENVSFSMFHSEKLRSRESYFTTTPILFE